MSVRHKDIVKKVINCLKEENHIIQKKLRRVSLDEGMGIAKELFEILNKRKDGIGLAANQVGIDAAVAVVNVTKPYILINPEIIEAWDEIPFYEGCLSYPGKAVHTKRYESVRIKTEQIPEGGSWIFSGVGRGESGKGSWEDGEIKEDRELRTLEAVCIQHEIDHLNGVRIMDRVRNTTVISEKKVGRNHIVTIKKGDAVKVLKYKKAQKFLSDGWVME